MFDKQRSYCCPFWKDPETCNCASCYNQREWDRSSAALNVAEANNFSSSGAAIPSMKPMLEPELPKMTMKERLEAQSRQNLAQREKNWKYVQANKERYAAQRADQLARQAQAAYDLTEKEWNKDLKEDLKAYLEKRHTQVCIFTVDDAAKCAINIWQQKNIDGETIGTETLKLLEEIHSKFDIGVGLVAATKVTKALGGLGVTVKQYLDAKGKEKIIISSLWNDKKMHYAVVNGLNIKKNHPYPISNPTVKQLGVLAKDTVNGFKKGAVLSMIISAGINTNELVFNDDYHLVDWFGHVGSDFFKAMTVLSTSAYVVSLTVGLGIALPILAGVVLWVGVDWAINEIWESFKIEDAIVEGLKNATNS
ncbi:MULTISPECIES: hypothetical protein [Vibrio]|uniref:Channel forming colicins domain-containing protein n=3 Tax=Vibrio anguillarum TaxID=55601 RepID=A0AAW4AXK9_VIBAN|nr:MULTISPECIES: hypothetical protein [Vibrio]AEH31904.1 hypothetical protein VAA_00607 [Vibrio anguillarum 775]AGU58735.1 hypothetical protein N175_01625 [Vibrio anguillarum M3]ARV26786.1 hypothetical protein A6A12_2647 [Vibrio anguillarum]ASF93130.1 hypothetical protein CEA93_14200 [Vibrio anguillarum]ATA48281.1 hypothetical protein CLI14_00515 [Vibrio anguillarum]